MATRDVQDRVRELLAELGMRDALAAFDTLLPDDPTKRVAALAFAERLLHADQAARVERRIQRRLDACRLPDRPTLEAFDFDFQPKLDRALVMELAQLAWVDRQEDLVLVGQSGVGKSHIAKALCLIGCKQQRWARYTSCADMMAVLYASLADGSLSEALKLYTRPALLLIDDLGYDPLEQERAREAQLLYKVLEARHGQRSTIITSNLSVDDWANYLGDHYLTVALLDRLLYHATAISIEGPSYRLAQHKKRQQERRSDSTP
jgi:DNA replication protein DnaC